MSSAWVTHPIETALEAAFFPIAALVGFDPSAFTAFVVVVFCVNTIGHSGREIYSKSFFLNLLGLVLTSPTHHKMHHSEVNKNFGAYFCFWDRWMGTESKNYAVLRRAQNVSQDRESPSSK